MPSFTKFLIPNNEIDKLLGITDLALRVNQSAKLQNYDPKTFYTDGLTSAEALYTDYQDLLLIYQLLKNLEVKSFCDLGAGVGRAKLLFDYLQSPFKNYSVEFVKERHIQGLQAHKKNQLSFPQGFINSDLSKAFPPKAESYFIYLPVNDVLFKTLGYLEELFTHTSCYLIAIESHGDLLPYLEMTHPFVKSIKKIPLKSKRHNENLMLYQWGPTASYQNFKNSIIKKINSVKSPLEITFKNNLIFWMLWKILKDKTNIQVIIKDQRGQWLADLEGSQFGISPNTLETVSPPRIISIEQIRAFILPCKQWLAIVEERRNQKKDINEKLRKIFISPKPHLEYSSGEIKSLELAWPPKEMTTLEV